MVTIWKYWNMYSCDLVLCRSPLSVHEGCQSVRRAIPGGLVESGVWRAEEASLTKHLPGSLNIPVGSQQDLPVALWLVLTELEAGGILVPVPAVDHKTKKCSRVPLEHYWGALEQGTGDPNSQSICINFLPFKRGRCHFFFFLSWCKIRPHPVNYPDVRHRHRCWSGSHFKMASFRSRGFVLVLCCYFWGSVMKLNVTCRLARWQAVNFQPNSGWQTQQTMTSWLNFLKKIFIILTAQSGGSNVTLTLSNYFCLPFIKI